MQEVTDSLCQTISRCFQQLHFLYWWRGWRNNAPSILIPKKLFSNSSGNFPYTMVLHINARLKSATYTVCWCDVFKHIVVKCFTQTKFPCNVLQPLYQNMLPNNYLDARALVGDHITHSNSRDALLCQETMATQPRFDCSDVR